MSLFQNEVGSADPQNAAKQNLPATPLVSYVVTQFDKAFFLPLVVKALAEDAAGLDCEFVFVDDGSTDDSVAVLRGLAGELPGPLKLIEQENAGASAATNTGVLAAAGAWIRLVDGDDLVTPGSTRALLKAAEETGHHFAYGDLADYEIAHPFPLPAVTGPARELLRAEQGLARFIRNCPGNSSSILVRRDHYRRSGGCDETLVSPDQLLFLRLFCAGGGVHLPVPVAMVPKAAPARLSGQKRRSRYESLLALHTALGEHPALPRELAALAYRRAISRAYTYSRRFGGGRLGNVHFWRWLASKFWLPADPVAAIPRSLSAFTETGAAERPESWQPSALRRGIARRRIA